MYILHVFAFCINSYRMLWYLDQHLLTNHWSTLRKGDSAPAWEGTGTRRRAPARAQGAPAGGVDRNFWGRVATRCYKQTFLCWILSTLCNRYRSFLYDQTWFANLSNIFNNISWILSDLTILDDIWKHGICFLFLLMFFQLGPGWQTTQPGASLNAPKQSAAMAAQANRTQRRTGGYAAPAVPLGQLEHLWNGKENDHL